MSLFIDEAVKKIPYYPKAAMYGMEEGWVRLASNENPLPPSKEVVSHLLEALLNVNWYPGGEAGLKVAVAGLYGIKPDQIVFGAGSDELIEMVLRAMKCAARDTVVVTGSVYLIGEVLARLEPQRGLGEGRLQDF